MSENKTNGNGTNGDEKSEKAKRIPVVIKEYDTREEAEENRPEGAEADAWKVYECKYPTKTVYFWAVGSVNALSKMALELGCSVSLGTARGPRQMKPSTMLEVIKGKSDDELRAEGYSEMVITAIRADTAAKTSASAAPTTPETPAPTTPKKTKGKPAHLATH